jgi:acetyl esterase
MVIPADVAPESRAILERAAQLGLLDDDGVRSAPELRERSLLERELHGPPLAVGRLEELTFAGPAGRLPARAYVPAGDPPFATIAFLHGGGWVVGDLDQADVDCRTLCVDTGALVISLDYRLAPEHRFPAAIDDAVAGVLAAAAEAPRLGGDPTRLVVAGDSAGGNLAAAVALMAAEAGAPRVAHQVLIYPALACDFETESYRRYAEDYWLSRDSMRWMWEQYLGDLERARDPRACPLSAPPALVVTAGCDVLRDDGHAYAERLRQACVPVAVRRHPGQIHGFWSCGGVTDAPRRVNAQIAAALRRAGLL